MYTVTNREILKTLMGLNDKDLDHADRKKRNIDINQFGGLKAFAANYFKQIGVFSKQLLIISPNIKTKVKAIAEQYQFNSESGYTLRYSYQDELGLPRFFSKSKTELLSQLEESYDKKWTVIIHPYIDVRRSFEINIDESDWVLEHVPGMWESDNILPPDQISSIQNKRFQAATYKNERTAKIAGVERWYPLESRPITKATALHWCSKISPIAEKLRHDFWSNLPLNFHFVEDKAGAWHFLNIRKGFEISHQEPFAQRYLYHEVSSLADLERWDKKSVLLLKLTTTRGTEKQLLESINWIGKFTRIVFVEFGLLSHPAILLRERGIKVLPSRLLAASTGVDQYETYELTFRI